MDKAPSSRQQATVRWSALLFVLAAVMLVASVVLPAAESESVLQLLRDEERLIEPLRLLAGQLVSGLAEESGELHRYGINGDSVALLRYRNAAIRDDENVLAMRRIASGLDDGVAGDATAIGGLLRRWRSLTPDDPSPLLPAANLPKVTGARESVRDSLVVATTRLELRLAAWSADKRAAVKAHERRGIVINAVLVLIALVALLAVFQLTRRERRRAQRESALRVAAEGLARAYSVPDVARHVAEGVVTLVRSANVIVAHVDDERSELRLAAAAGAPPSVMLPRQTDNSYHGSVIETVIGNAKPIVVAAAVIAGENGIGRAMIIPLGTRETPVGAVIALESAKHRFDRHDLAWAEIFGHLASLSYEKVRLLEQARSGRERLQRLMDSRGRLIRGFSHDVKNPLGAADGYAALLQDGIYGAVSDEQRASIARVRDAIHRALSLIDDLHELARAETGHLGIRMEITGLGALVSACADEFRAAAAVKHLEFTCDADAELPDVETDPSRVRQIVGNLLSNAIKYTATGSITLRARSYAGDHPADASHVFVEVEDTGPGIPVEKHEIIFEEFARLAGGSHSGAGLGLAISKHVADALGCRLELRSDVGRGSTFALCIPVRAQIAGPSRTDAAGSAEPSTHARSTSEATEVRSA
ncbi:MAG: GAF domain-containing sensor histidine kinase [Gemmatimonadales bacterium]